VLRCRCSVRTTGRGDSLGEYEHVVVGVGRVRRSSVMAGPRVVCAGFDGRHMRLVTRSSRCRGEASAAVIKRFIKRRGAAADIADTALHEALQSHGSAR